MPILLILSVSIDFKLYTNNIISGPINYTYIIICELRMRLFEPLINNCHHNSFACDALLPHLVNIHSFVIVRKAL